jgi:predicted glycoside hydrolase/deacetylase ChbG (UPF0249 family)
VPSSGFQARAAIINADDFGLSPGVSLGILICATAGIVSSTTVLANMAGIAHWVKKAVEVKGLGIGAHLNVTTGRPLTRRSAVRALVDHRGRFHPPAYFRDRVDTSTLRQLHAEWSAQIERLTSLGAQVGHLDSHHNVAYSHPAITEVFLQLASSLYLPVRPAPAGSDCHPESRALVEAFRGGGGQPTRLETLFMTDRSTQAARATLSRIRPQEVVELMVHPGIPDRRLRSVSTYAAERGEEVETLCDQGLVDWVRSSKDLTLVNYLPLHDGDATSLDEPGGTKPA